MNTIIPHYIDDLYKESLENRYHGKETEERYIEVKEDLVNLMNSDLFRLGGGKFMNMLQKRYYKG